ncbi:hypothetical protein GPECTOR_80g141 [Gonium pectorale]|uniref:G8 domain-containing protein n=1 Tax=Gonium pectorale TaxID=33097 RepID=A0A150G1U4_GONPE|nr:hypothetical protein GPECTOR_80g141 [Gonium pectorale]|eukprot:KXZ43781.1 hypothetical protein GPECTOR_80g141 [Gonium pectorale]
MLASGALFKSITVPQDSELVIDDAPMNLTVTTIMVRGKLSMGSHTCRLRSAITVTFVPSAGVDANMMTLRGTNTSTVDIHGALFSPTWTRLSQTAYPGSRWVALQQPVNWAPGQLVAVPTSLWKDECRNQNEVRVIESVSADGTNVTFTAPLSFLHYGGPEYQTEVVLLSRNLLFQGSPETAALNAGGHIRIEGVSGRIRGAMAYRVGNQYSMGSYPFHFHMSGDVTGVSYMTDNSVYNSYWRCYTIHGTHGLLVQSNTAFHAHGSCYYIEDGVEERNVVDRNFAGYIHPLGRGTDTCSSAGSVFSAPVISQLSRNVPLEPYKRPVGAFDGNTAHSSGYHWEEAATIYVGGDLKYAADGTTLQYTIQRTTFDPRDINDPTVLTKFRLTNSKVWLGGVSISTYGDRILVDGFESHDGTMGAQLRGEPNELVNADLNMNSGHSGFLIANVPGDLRLDMRYGLQFYDTFYRNIARNVTIRNVPYNTAAWQDQAALISLSFSDQFKPGHLSTVRDIRLVNVSANAAIRNPVVKSGSWRWFNFLDSDGSFTGRGRPTVVASYSATNDTGPGPTCVPSATTTCQPFNYWSTDDSCSTASPQGDVWNTISCDWYPWRTVAKLNVVVPGYTLTVDESNTFASVNNVNDFDAGYVAQFGFTGANRRASIITRLEGISGLTGKNGWYVHWTMGAPKTFSVKVEQVPRGTSVIYATRYPAGTTFTIVRTHSWRLADSVLLPGSSLADVLASPAGEVYYFDGSLLYMKIIDTAELPYQGRTPISNGGAMVPAARWSSPSYDVTANVPSCVAPSQPVQNGQNVGAQFCAMGGALDDYIPPAITASYDQWNLPYCAEIAPPVSVCSAFGVSAADCKCSALAGRCPDLSSSWIYGELGALALKAGGYCAVTCGRCEENKEVCLDMPMPASLSGGRTCEQLVPLGLCYDVVPRGYCLASCGICSGAGLPCTDRQFSNTSSCADLRSWGSCNSQWSPAFEVFVGRQYTFCVWARVQAGPVTVSITLQDSSTFATYAWQQSTLTTTWQQICQPRAAKPATQTGTNFAQFKINFGTALTTFYFDQATITGPRMELLTGYSFTFCIFGRLSGGAGQPTTATVNLSLQDSDTNAVYASGNVGLTTSWVQRCLSGAKPAGQGTTWAQFKVNMGTAVATFHFDQATITQV